MDQTVEQPLNNGNIGDSWKVNAWAKGGANQPDPEAKRRGHLKKKMGRELLKTILAMDFKGMGPEFKIKLGEYYGLDPEEITNEGALVLSQLITAIQKGDTFAFNAIMDRAYGKPKELIEFQPNNNPQFVVEMLNGNSNEVPPIATSEDEIGTASSSVKDVQ